jgi:hypothetical protein
MSEPGCATMASTSYCAQTGGDPRQLGDPRKRPKQAKSVAVGCAAIVGRTPQA